MEIKPMSLEELYPELGILLKINISKDKLILFCEVY
jgi:hypothetical protein